MWGVAEWNLRTKYYVRLTFIPHAGPALVHHVDSTAKLGRNRCESLQKKKKQLAAGKLVGLTVQLLLTGLNTTESEPESTYV
jgi:hypothetical protein